MQTQKIQGAPRIIYDEAQDKALSAIFRETTLFKNAAGTYKRPAKMLMAESEASTNGWDTVYSIKTDYLNQAIANTKPYPPEAEKTIEEMSRGQKLVMQLKAEFDAWSIVGGGGDVLHLSIPIRKGTFHENGEPYDLKDVKVTIEVMLSYYPKPAAKMATGKYQIKVATDAGEQDGEDPVVMVRSSSWPGRVDRWIKNDVEYLMEEWLNEPATLDKIGLTFASVIIDQIGDEYKWLKTTSSGYAYGQSSTVGESVFQVLSMTMDNTPPAIRGYCYCDFRSGDKAVFMINTGTFLEYTVKPGLEQQYPKVTFTQSGRKLTGTGLPLDPVKVNGAKYYPTVTNFEVSFEGKEVVLRTSAEVEVSPGIKGFLDSTSRYKLGLATDQTTHQQTLVYTTDVDPVVQSHTEIATWVVVVEVVASVVAAVLGAIVAKIAETVAFRVIILIITAIVAALVGSIAVIIEKVIAAGSIKELPSILPMVDAATKSVTWPRDKEGDLDYFQIETFELNGDILMKGIPMAK